MGQRLVVNVVRNDKTLATVYYHWSAYTMSALYTAKELIDFFYEINYKKKGDDDLVLELIRYCEENGGGLSADEHEAAKIKYPDCTFAYGDRNYGLVSFSLEGMNTSHSWSEGDLEINLDSEEIYNGVFGVWDKEGYMDCYYDEEYDYTEYDNIPLYDDNPLSVIAFKDIDNTIQEAENLPHFFRCCIDSNCEDEEIIVEIIE